MDTEQLHPIDRSMVADLYLSDQGYRLLTDLVDRFGPRFGGSASERAAAAFLSEYLSGLGLQSARVETFPTLGWERAPARLVANDTELPCIALPLSPGGMAAGDLICVGPGGPAEFAERAAEIAGKIVMVTTADPPLYHRAVHRVEKVGRAIALGAVGVIWMRSEPGLLEETGAARFGAVAEVPVVAVSHETGRRLLRMRAAGPVRVQIGGQHRIAEVESGNAVAELPGSTDEVIVVGAHYDGHDISDAAQDNGTGTAVLLEAARALAPHRSMFRRTVRFVAFAQEEQGLMGAHAYVERHRADLAAHVFMLNLDVAGRPGSTSFLLQGWPEAQPAFRKLFADLREDVTVYDSLGPYSDHYPFALGGVPSAHLCSSDPRQVGRGWSHTAADTLDKVSAQAIQADAIKVARMVLRLATAPTLPFRSKEPGEITAMLRAQGLEEPLRIERRPLRD